VKKRFKKKRTKKQGYTPLRNWGELGREVFVTQGECQEEREMKSDAAERRGEKALFLIIDYEEEREPATRRPGKRESLKHYVSGVQQVRMFAERITLTG